MTALAVDFIAFVFDRLRELETQDFFHRSLMDRIARSDGLQLTTRLTVTGTIAFTIELLGYRPKQEAS